MPEPAFDPSQLININPEDLFGPKELTTTSTSDIAKWLKPYATGMLNRAQAFAAGKYPYPDQRVAAMTPAQQTGQAEALQYAQGSGPMVDMANALGMATMGGSFLSPESNPWLQQTYDAAARGVTDQYMYGTAPGTAANFNRAGSFGGSAMNQQQEMDRFGLGENLKDLATSIYGGNYQTERQRQYGQQSYTPQILNQQYIGPNAMMDVGASQQAQTQNVLNTGYQNAWNRANWPVTSGQFMSGMITPFTGAGDSSTTGPNPNYSSPFANLLGLGMINAGGMGGFGGGLGGFGGLAPGAAAGFQPGFGF